MIKKVVVVISIFILSSGLFSQTQFVFGVKPDISLNSAYIGITQNKIMPFIGIDLLWISAELNDDVSYTTYYSQTSYDKDVMHTNMTGDAFLIVPHIGCKYFFNRETTRPYLFSSFFFSLPQVSLDLSGSAEITSYENNTQTSHEVIESTEIINDEAIETTIQDLLGFWGFNIGAGAEHFFSSNFSLGGEYGIRFLFDSADYEDQYGSLDEQAMTGTKNTWNRELKASLKMSYALISANFYF